VSEATQETRTAVTGPGGTFQFSLLKPGRYSITIEKAGFRKAVQKSEVLLGQTASANAKLEVGEATQTVEITESIPLLQTEDANITSNVDLRTLQNIPNPAATELHRADIPRRDDEHFERRRIRKFHGIRTASDSEPVYD